MCYERENTTFSVINYNLLFDSPIHIKAYLLIDPEKALWRDLGIVTDRQI